MQNKKIRLERGRREDGKRGRNRKEKESERKKGRG
jgi:hypothetical protein